MPVPDLRSRWLTPVGAARGLPLLVVGPSLGTTTSMWEPIADLVAGSWDVLAYDLPGHGQSPVATRPFTVDDLASAVLDTVERAADGRATRADRLAYAGDSLGGAVGLALALAAPARVQHVWAVCTGAKIGEPRGWHDRAAVVRADGVAAVVDGSRQRWFGPSFHRRAPDVVERLVAELRTVDAESYALACEALAAYDLRAELPRLTCPIVAISGSDDVATPPKLGAQIAAAAPRGCHVVLNGVGQLAPAEDPAGVAATLTGS